VTGGVGIKPAITRKKGTICGSLVLMRVLSLLLKRQLRVVAPLPLFKSPKYATLGEAKAAVFVVFVVLRARDSALGGTSG